jgi:hypothetical protein
MGGWSSGPAAAAFAPVLWRKGPVRGDARQRPRLSHPPDRDNHGEEGQPTDKVFLQGGQLKLFNRIMSKSKLKLDRDGNPRTAYSLRHTYICMRLMEGAGIYQIAKNCRTSVEMIERFYAAHIKNTLDAAAINVMRSKVAKAADKPTKQAGNDAVKLKSGKKPIAQIERIAPEQIPRDTGLRVTDDSLMPGALTSEA